MKRLKIDFLIALPALAFIAYVVLGGGGVFLVGLFGLAWRMAPFRAQAPYGAFSEDGATGSSMVEDMLRKVGAHLPNVPPREGSLLILADIVVAIVVFLAGLALGMIQLTGVG